MRSSELVSFLLAAQQEPNPATPLIMMILMFVIMYFLLIRPQKVRQRELEGRIAKIKTGDKVVTTAGIHGLVANVKESTLVVKLHQKNNIKLEFEKSAVATITPKNEVSDDDDSDDASSEAEAQSA